MTGRDGKIDMRATGRVWLVMVCLSGGLIGSSGCKPSTAPTPTANPTAGSAASARAAEARRILEAMVAAYQTATTYCDQGVVSYAGMLGERKLDETFPCLVALERPNKLRLEVYQGKMVCDGKELHAAIQGCPPPQQVLAGACPPQVTLKTVYGDKLFSQAITGVGGRPAEQLILLLGEEPMKSLLEEPDGQTLLDPAELEGHRCFRVSIKRHQGTDVFWIDEQTYVLRRIEYPVDSLRRAMEKELRDKGIRDPKVEPPKLVADFPGAQLNGKIESPGTFQFEVPLGAQLMEFFIPPEEMPGRLLGKKTPDFKFIGLDGKAVLPETLRGKVAVLDFWATYCEPCREMLPELQKVYEKYKDNAKVTFVAVSIDGKEVEDKALVEMMQQLKVTIPVARDLEGKLNLAFWSPGIPAMALFDPQGVVEDFQLGGGPDAGKELAAKIDKLLAGEHVYPEAIKDYQEAASVRTPSGTRAAASIRLGRRPRPPSPTKRPFFPPRNRKSSPSSPFGSASSTSRETFSCSRTTASRGSSCWLPAGP